MISNDHSIIKHGDIICLKSFWMPVGFADVVAIDDLTCHSLNWVDAFVKPSSVYWWRNGEPQFARQHGYHTVHVVYRHTYTSMILWSIWWNYIVVYIYIHISIYIYMYIINKSYVTCLYTHYISLWIFTIRGWYGTPTQCRPGTSLQHFATHRVAEQRKNLRPPPVGCSSTRYTNMTR